MAHCEQRKLILPHRIAQPTAAMFGRALQFVKRNPKTVIGALATVPAIWAPTSGCDGTRATADWPEGSNRFMPDHPRGDRPKRNYAEYLNLYYLLDLQRDDEGATVDEQHFIVVHQIFELWFKLIIQELIEASELLEQSFVPEEEIPRVVHKLNRCTQIFKLLAQQWKVVETLQPQDFLAFRDGLGTASGFESFQIRQLEMMVGVKQADRPQNFKAPLDHFREMAQNGNEADANVLKLMERVDAATPLVDVIGSWLARTPIDGSLPSDEGDNAVVERFVNKYLALHQDTQNAQAERMKVGGISEVRLKAAIEKQAANRKEAVDWIKPEGQVGSAAPS